jgi:hypothetical protein
MSTKAVKRRSSARWKRVWSDNPSRDFSPAAETLISTTGRECGKIFPSTRSFHSEKSMTVTSGSKLRWNVRTGPRDALSTVTRIQLNDVPVGDCSQHKHDRMEILYENTGLQKRYIKNSSDVEQV